MDKLPAMKTPIAFTLACLAISTLSCMERKMTITSEPPGAMVTLSDVEVGRTPVTMPFTWYGDYDIILRMDGFQTVSTHAKINPPIYAVPPWDFMSEIVPWTYKDNRYLNYKLSKAVQPTTRELLDRAEKLKARNIEPVKK
jgi:hypothetical protein